MPNEVLTAISSIMGCRIQASDIATVSVLLCAVTYSEPFSFVLTSW